MIDLVDVSRSFREGDREQRVLDRVCARIRTGELVALLGPSGSGKSTLLNLIAGIDAPDSGQIVVGGTNIATLGEHDRTLYRRRRVGFVFQFFNLIPTLSVADNVLLPLQLDGPVDAARREAALAWLDRVGLGDRRETFPDRLSGGEQQRVAVARALASEPLLVLADEPTGNLDAATARQVLDLLESLVRESGRTMLMVTHSEAAAARADRTLVIRDRRLVELDALAAAGRGATGV